ncbi:hypothetical protein FZEAL_4675 [Fusarium zealandicum]|uniref:Amino acid permease/ SLC12A domain-containing protein n=1 Tax=Fusarium zealandicum TaxID=1053134 RepID=A0A8H4XKK3_9HYPO|nr:hypothetical protein FZEAL_4675 [Fusarium zealandicum]
MITAGRTPSTHPTIPSFTEDMFSTRVHEALVRRGMRWEPCVLGDTSDSAGTPIVFKDAVRPKASVLDIAAANTYKVLKTIDTAIEDFIQSDDAMVPAEFKYSVPTVANLTRSRPETYLIPLNLAPISERLSNSGVEAETLAYECRGTAQAYNATSAKLDDGFYESVVRDTATTEPSEKKLLMPAGRLRVSSRQKNAAMAFVALEPESDVSFISHNADNLRTVALAYDLELLRTGSDNGRAPGFAAGAFRERTWGKGAQAAREMGGGEVLENSSAQEKALKGRIVAPGSPRTLGSSATMAYQREFEMQAIPPSLHPKKPEILVESSFAVTIVEPEKPVLEPAGAFDRLMYSFGRAPSRRITAEDDFGLEGNNNNNNTAHASHGRFFNLRRANQKSANTALARELKNRHLQMIAIGGSIGTGLFVASGLALYRGGPGSLLLAFVTMGIMQFFTMQALGELSVAFPVGGSFSNYSTRFLDPSWGFAMGWNYALQYLIVLPLEIIAGAFTTMYWNPAISKPAFVAGFLLLILFINLLGVRSYGEAEFIFSTVKVVAIIGFILLGIIINVMGHPDDGYIGFQYWENPGAFNHGLKGFASVLVTATFSFAGTEMVGLASAETANPRKSLPAAVKQVFWRISIFYITSILLIGLLVPYDEPRLLGARFGSDAVASPFVIAIESGGQTVLPSVMNAVILIALISVGNTAVYASSRTLAALAEQSLAPKAFSYIDRRGRPLVAILFACFIGLLAFLADTSVHAEVFNWLLAISGLSTLFTWASICLCHIRFRKAWALSGYSLSQLAFRSQVGVLGSYIALAAYSLVLVLQIWVAASPIQVSDTVPTAATRVKGFMMQVLTVPIIFTFYFFHKLWCRTRIVRHRDIDVDTGRRYLQVWNEEEAEAKKSWPLWKRMYNLMC